MYFKHLQTIIALTAGVLLTGCRSDIDLKNIDPKAEVELGMALPVGNLHVTMGDFLGNDKVKGISVDQDGIFHYIKDLEIPTKDYHTINVANYIIKDVNTLEFPVGSKLAGYGNPLPASPALAASIEAFKASRFVCAAIWLIVLIISTILLDFSEIVSIASNKDSSWL